MNYKLIIIISLCFFSSVAHAETLSGFLRKSLGNNKIVIVLEGDKDIGDKHDSLDKIAASNNSIRRKLEEIGRNCDYLLDYHDGIYILSKQYSDLLEIPCITDQEMVSYAADIKYNLNALFKSPSGKNRTFYIHKLLKSLSDSEWQSIQSDRIPVASLSESSRAVLNELLIETYSSSLRTTCEQFLKFCKDSDNSKFAMRQSDDKKYMVYIAGGKDNLEWPLLPDSFTDPLFNIKKFKSANISFSGTNLSDILQSLEAKHNIKITVSKSLVKKPLSIIGIDLADPVKLIKSISRLYDLKIDVKNQNTFHLRERKVLFRNDYQLGDNIIDACPQSIKKSLLSKNYSRTTKGILLTLVPSIEKSKTNSLFTSNLDYIYKVSVFIDVFTQLAISIRNNLMPRLQSYVDGSKQLYIQCKRTQGGLLELFVSYKEDGQFFRGPRYGTSHDVDRE